MQNILNKEQEKAVKTTEGYIRLIAGAGTGKTKTLTHRYAYLVQELGININNILSVTFTNKAANEMKSRIRKLIGDFETSFINTFHGFCTIFLREEIYFVYYPRNFTIIDTEDQKLILKEIYEELNLTSKDYRYSDVLNEIEKRKGCFNYVENLADIDLKNIKAFIDDKSNFDINPIEYIFYKFLYKQRKIFALDFNDLIQFTLYILQNNKTICKKWQNKMQYIQVDEFQDTSTPEFKLVKILSEKYHNLFVVGDPDQLIYTWRGARNFIQTFDIYFEKVQTLFLLQNYRSTKNIINCSNSLISKNPNRIDKELTTNNESGNLPKYFHAKTVVEEAQWIVKNIKNLINNGANPNQIAILYRSNYLSRVIEEELLKEYVPYIIYNGIEFYSRMEIKDCLAYLRMIVFEDDLSFLRVVNTPKRGIGKTRIDFLKKYSEECNVSLYQALKDNINHPLFKTTTAKEFVNAIEKFKYINYLIDNDKDLEFKQETSTLHLELKETEKINKISILFDGIIKQSGYENFIMSSGDNERFENIQELKNSIVNYENMMDEKFLLSDYLQNIALITDRERRNSNGCVRLMTIHTAKGLEFDNVFICGLNEGVFPSSRTCGRLELEEERRVCYVALTRARNNLFLSDAEGVSFNGGFRFPSRFLFNIEKEHVMWENESEIDSNLLIEAQKYIKQDEDKIYQEIKILEVGDKINHKTFGCGIVKKVENDFYEIYFDDIKTVRNINRNYFKVE